MAALGHKRPFVYATLATVFNKMHRLHASMLEALGELDADVLMLVGRDLDFGDVGEIEANVESNPSSRSRSSFLARR